VAEYLPSKQDLHSNSITLRERERKWRMMCEILMIAEKTA
jgi:hypothetical protein